MSGDDLRAAGAGAGESEEEGSGVGRRVFIRRLAAATAATAGSAALPGSAAGAGTSPPEGRAPAGRAGGAARGTGASPVRTRGGGARDPFSRPVPLPDPSRIEAAEPYELTVAEAASLVRDGRLSPVELVESFVGRIEAHDDIYRAFNRVLVEEAAERARQLEDAPWRGPLHGIPLALKDNFYTAGIATTANSRIFEDFVPEFDATATRRLEGAGAIVLGKTQMGPLATSRATTPEGDYTTYNAWAPHDIEVSPGGSSSGSATATAARMASLATGTQTGGSITRPSDRQGLTGLKPTMGRVSLYGIIPLTYTRDHPGPLARDARDAAIALQAVAGPDPADPRTRGLPPVPDYLSAAQPSRRGGEPAIGEPTTVGVVPGYLDPDELVDEEEQDEELSEEEKRERERRRRTARAEVEARRRMLGTFERLGARVVEVDYPEDWDTLTDWTFNNVRLPERSEPFLEVLRDDVREFGVSLSPWINGLLLSGTEYLRGQRAKLLLARRVLDDLFDECDVVVQKRPFAFDSIGLPLISFPIGFEEEIGFPRPIGALVGARPYREDRLLSLAGAYQAITEHHTRSPAEPDSFPLEERDEGSGDRAAGPGRMDPRDVMRYGQ